MIRSQEQDEFIAVRVQDPRVQNEGSWNSYVDFKIFLHTNSKAFTAKTSCVRRRFSEFVWLKKKLQKYAGLVPHGHPKRFTSCLTFTHSLTHSNTDGGVSHARRHPARREQLGLGVLLKDTSTLGQVEPGIEPPTFRPVPDLPKKTFFSFINDELIERRRKGLQSFLDKVLHMTVCLSDSQLHLFLQTQLPVKHIEDCVQGHTPYTVTEAILTYASSNRGWVQEEGDVDETQKLWPTTLPYESVESPAPHLPSLQSPGATSSGPLNELTDVSDFEWRLSDAEQSSLDLKHGIGHEQLPQEGESYIKLVVEVHPNLVVSVETEEEDGNIYSKETQRLDEDAKDLQSYDCEYLAPQIAGLIEDELQQGDAHNEEDLDQETSVAEDAVEVTSVDEVIEKKIDDINEAKKGSQDVGLELDSTVRQTPNKVLHEEDPGESIHKNEVTIDLSADAEKVLETEEDVALHDACEESTSDTEDRDKAEITEEHVVQENGVSDDNAVAQEVAINENEVHVGEVNKLNAKCLQPGSALLILEGSKEAVSMQTPPVTVSNLNANTADVNTLVLQAIEMDSKQCHEMDIPPIITTHQTETNSHGN